MLRPFSALLSLVTAVLALCATVAAADTMTASGVPADFEEVRTSPAPIPPAGLDDTLFPLHQDGPTTAVGVPDVCDLTTVEESQSPAAPCWAYLTGIAPEARSAAAIEVEPLSAIAAGDLETSRAIAALWNGGRPAEAIDALRRFEEAGARVAVGVSWSGGAAPAGGREGTDVRIGDRTGGRHVDVDHDAQTGNLFSVIGWGGTSGAAYWSCYISTDHGATWTMTYDWYSGTTPGGLIKVDAAVVGDWLYVGYVSGEDTGQLRVRRCRVTNGSIDSIYSWKLAIDAGTQTFTDMVVVSNADDFDNRIYFLGIQDNAVLRFAWALTDAQTFNNVTPPATANASNGLSATWEAGNACAEYLYVSYRGTDDHIHVLRRTETEWTDEIVQTNAGSYRSTSISAYDGVVICAFEFPMTAGIGIRYEISYDCGAGWNYGDLAVPDGSSVSNYMQPSVEARTGLGTAIVYQAEVGEPDRVIYRSRTGYAPGAWPDSLAFNDLDVSTGSDTVLNPLSPRGGPTFDLGAIYLGFSYIPYFDQPARDFSDVPGVPASASSLRLLPASPNPFRDQTAIRFELPEPAHARLELFDLLGRRVATLLDKEIEAGAHEIALGSRGLKTGLYLYRLTTGSDVGSGQLIVIP